MVFVSDPVLEVRRLFTNEKTEPLLVYKSETLTDTVAPRFKPFEISELMVGSIDAPFLLRMVDMTDPRRLIGDCVVSLRQLSLGPWTFALLNKDKMSRPLYTSSGGLQVDNVEIIPLTALPPIPPALRFSITCTEIDNSDASQDLCVELWRLDAKEPSVQFRTEREKYGGSLTWKDFDLSVSQIGGIDIPLSFRVTWLNFKKSKISKVGACLTSLRELLFTNGATTFNLIHAKRQKRCVSI